MLFKYMKTNTILLALSIIYKASNGKSMMIYFCKLMISVVLKLDSDISQNNIIIN